MKGKRVELKPIQREHLQKIVEWRNDPEVSYWAMGSNPLYEFTSAEEAEKSFSYHVENTSKLDAYTFAIYSDNDEFIGTVDYRDVDRIKRSCTIGISIGEKNYWGKGYGSDAIMVLVDYIFKRLNLRRIQLDTWSGNERAIKSFQKCGFEIEGKLRENEYINGKYFDTILMALIRE